MNALAFECGCPDCGGELVMLAAGVPGSRRTTAMVRCADCAADVQVIVALDVTHRPRFKTPQRRAAI